MLSKTEKQLVLKTAGDLVEEYYRTQHFNVKQFSPFQDPKWDLNTTAGREMLENYQEWIAKGAERAISKPINWSALYAIKQGPSASPSEFLDHKRDAMHRHTSLV